MLGHLRRRKAPTSPTDASSARAGNLECFAGDPRGCRNCSGQPTCRHGRDRAFPCNRFWTAASSPSPPAAPFSSSRIPARASRATQRSYAAKIHSRLFHSFSCTHVALHPCLTATMYVAKCALRRILTASTDLLRNSHMSGAFLKRCMRYKQRAWACPYAHAQAQHMLPLILDHPICVSMCILCRMGRSHKQPRRLQLLLQRASRTQRC